uniref:Nuclear receptor subfamily 1, group D, member 2b n=1 Tax=Tetraodon nigroviridis TaxID=99883 RepID=H3D270_TETNG
GFHYGVHACEGCKGFFRRSIQQNIQYKKCLKSESCAIMRINRNRCQQCRFKKCLMVGMSRDSVRFGRIPKREKQRMLLGDAECHEQHDEQQEDSVQKHRPFRMSRDASHTPTYAHGALRAPPPACPASRGPQWRGGNRMYLVCPMNMSAYVDPQKSGQEVWEEFSHSFTPAVREVVEFAKKIPGFRDLSQHDQVSLLKAGTFEVLVVRFASLFDVQNRTVTFLGGRKYSMDALRAMGAGDLLNSMFDFSEKLMSLGLSEEEMSLFTAVVLVSADRSGIENVNSVEALQETLIRALRSLITKNHPNESAIFTKLLLKLPDLRSLNNMHSEQLLAFKLRHPSQLFPP